MNQELKNKKLFIFDMDGTIYLGDRVFPEAVQFIKRLRSEGKRVLFFTNNASRAPKTYFDRLTRLGFEPSQEEIMTSGDVTIEFLKRHRPGKSVYLVSTPDLQRQFSESGIALSDEKSGANIVVTSFDTTLTYAKLEAACRYIRLGAEFLSTHPDLNCPTENGPVPDSGAIAALITASTGAEPTYFGKPYAETINMIAEATGASRDEMCVFGDRMQTDIALGKRHGVTAVLVLTGVTSPEDVERAAPADRPDFVYDNLGSVSDDI